MAVFDKVYKTIMNVGAVVIGIVVLSIILLKFKAVDGVTANLNTTIDTAVSAIDEPVAWISIVIIALVGYAILKMFKKQKSY